MKDIVNLTSLTERESRTLLDIWKNCKTYKIRYKYPGLFQNELCWPETLKEWEWIKETVLSHFCLKADDIAHIPYDREDEAYKKTGFEIPYHPSAVNFVHFYPGDYVETHSNKTFSVPLEAKINVPVLNTSSAVLKFEKSRNTSRYPGPILLNAGCDHRAEGMGPDLRDDRVFLQMSLTKKYSHYYNFLKWSAFQENKEREGGNALYPS